MGCGQNGPTFEQLLERTETDSGISKEDRKIILEKIIEWTESNSVPKIEREDDWGRYSDPTLSYYSDRGKYFLFVSSRRPKTTGDAFGFTIDGKDMSIFYVAGR
jgi:hypothetical protein